MTITMLGFHFVLFLSTASHIYFALAAPVSHQSHQQPSLSATTASESASTSSKAVKALRNRVILPQKIGYKPRASSRIITGTARQQVEQFRYRMQKRGATETDAEYQGRIDAKEKALGARKRAHLRKIESLEKEFAGQGEDVITKQYNNWIQSKIDNDIFRRVKRVYNLEHLTKKELEEIRRKKLQEDENLSESHKLQYEHKNVKDWKYWIKKSLQKGDERSLKSAERRMKKYGITDLKDGRTVGAEKARLRKALKKDPTNEVALQDALRLGMDVNAHLDPASKVSRQENLKVNHSQSASSLQEQVFALPKKTMLTFDLNKEPPIELD
jgi:hypothetical protein